MDPWLEDIVEQLSISQCLIDSKLDSGKRLAIILIDNAVEFMFKAYGDLTLVGKTLNSCVDQKLKGKELSKTNWESIKDQKNFNLVMDWTLPNSPCTVEKQKISTYHDVRNTLYHKAIPLSVERKKAMDYLKIGKQLLQDLFEVKLNDDEWTAKKQETEIAISSEPPPKPIAFSVTDDNLIRIEAPGIHFDDYEAILLGIYALMTQLGRDPDVDELSKSLNYSGRPVQNLSVRISQLRSQDYITKDKLSLMPKAKKLLVTKFKLG